MSTQTFPENDALRRMAELRTAIDAADDAIFAALNRRFALTDEMRALKAANGIPSVDAERERAIYSRAIAAVPPAHRDVIYSVYERILGGSRGMIETVARGIAVRDGKLLVCLAKGGKNCYLPGGHIEFGETGKQALVREVREETGCDSEAGDFLGVLENTFDQHGRLHAEINLIYRLSVPPTAEVRAAEEWLEFDWRGPDELDDLLPRSMMPLIQAEFS